MGGRDTSGVLDGASCLGWIPDLSSVRRGSCCLTSGRLLISVRISDHLMGGLKFYPNVRPQQVFDWQVVLFFSFSFFLFFFFFFFFFPFFFSLPLLPMRVVSCPLGAMETRLNLMLFSVLAESWS